MRKKYSLATISTTLCSLLLVVGTASAVPLSGKLLIDPGIIGDKVVPDGQGGTIIIADRYLGGSYFSMNGNPNTGAMLSPGTAGGIILGTYQNFVLTPDEPHPAGWQGDINGDGIPDGKAGAGYGTRPAQEGTAFAPFAFFNSPTYIGINPIGYQSAVAHTAPGVELDMTSCVGSLCSITADFNAWEVMWNGSAFEQGPRPDNTGPFNLATGTYDLDSRAYTLGWTSQIKGGSFNGVTGTWYIEGTVVPVPAAVWLFGSGLLGLVGIARRKTRI